jgi:Tfp pilus assembly protein PilX
MNNSLHQRGSALVVALIMLIVLTILGITGMNIASTELVMAGGEQDRTRAFGAAEIGIERAIRNLDAYETTSAYRGSTDLINEFNGTKFEANHYQIRSQGNSARSAQRVIVQGVIAINTTYGQKTYGP